jgi:hypothetical protein
VSEPGTFFSYDVPDSSVCILTRLWAGRPENRGSDPVKAVFLFAIAFRSAVGCTQPTIHWVQVALSSGVKRPGHGAECLLPSSAEVPERLEVYFHMKGKSHNGMECQEFTFYFPYARQPLRGYAVEIFKD